ncbi:MAG: ATP-binding cassette domain-containing protein [Enterobacter hormaechei]
MASVQLRNVTKAWGDVVVSKDINLDIHEGEFVVFVGPSGCGKSTLLRMIAGLETITSGDVFIGDTNELTSRQLNAAGAWCSSLMRFIRIFPLPKNMSFGLKLAGAKKEIINQRSPGGGSAPAGTFCWSVNRSALRWSASACGDGRTLVAEPRVFLLDEPLLTSMPPCASDAYRNLPSAQNALDAR